MTNREEWLAAIAGTHVYGASVTCLPSFPRTHARRVILGEVVMNDSGKYVGLVSPALSDSVEVALVVHYLCDWWSCNTGSKMTARTVRHMTSRGWVDPAQGIIPTDEKLVTVTAYAERVEARLGAYPHAFVDVVPARVATQTTRLLKVSCALSHDPYIVRMSRAAFDRGAPLCGICSSLMSLAS